MSNSTIKISKNITKDRLPVQKKKKKKTNDNKKWSLTIFEYRKFQSKRKYLSIPDDKKFSLGNIRFETSVCHRSPNKLYLPVIHDPCRELDEQKHGRAGGKKKFPSPLEKFREHALCRPLKEAKAIEVSLNKLQKTSSFPTLF